MPLSASHPSAFSSRYGAPLDRRSRRSAADAIFFSALIFSLRPAFRWLLLPLFATKRRTLQHGFCRC